MRATQESGFRSQESGERTEKKKQVPARRDDSGLRENEREELQRIAGDADASAVYRYLSRACFRCFGPIVADGENAIVCGDLACGLRITLGELQTILGE